MNENDSLRVEVRMIGEQLEKQWPVRMQQQAEQELTQAAKTIVALAENVYSLPDRSAAV